ncbi:MAG TPA: chromate efflux transporter [Anaerolineales bacterium]|nr:chromate efflux transporter [Anaerolineales bacterium]
MNQNSTIVFVCEHGAAKSIVAAAYFNRLAAETGLQLRAVARGTHPDEALSPQAVEGLKADGLAPGESIPQKLMIADLESAARVITFCDLPLEYQNKTVTERWDEVPPVSENYEQARDLIVAKLNRLLARSDADPTIPQQTYPRLFLRFLRFGFLAWGGPVAQIAMVRQELVEEEKWISREKFNRVLSVYQALPGPEAHELCVYFGMLAGGRPGALLAGLGFMLPGFLLMLALSWLYISYGITSPLFQSVFLGMQPAVAALIVRAVHRIGGHALHADKWLWGIALLAGLAQLLGANFLVALLAGGLIYALVQQKHKGLGLIVGLGVLAYLAYFGLTEFGVTISSPGATSAPTRAASLLTLFWSGLKSGLLTFGGAYTVIPFLQRDAVEVGRWMTDAQFLDGLALSGLLPAPLIIFSTFVGYIGGGLPGAVIITVAIFAPAFAFTMIGHDYLERLVDNRSAHAFLDGVTAGVVGLISATALGILSAAVVGLHAWIIFSLALIALIVSKSKWTVAAVVAAAGLYGMIFL